MKKLQHIKLILLLIMFCFSACEKQNDWLNEKTNKSDVVPETLADYQAILDNTLEMNASAYPTIGIVASDNLRIANQDVAGLSEQERNIYLWNKQIWPGGVSGEWNRGYKLVEFANLVLDGLKNVPKESLQFNSIQGQAYFFRAIAYYNLAQVFCKSYIENTSITDLGLILRQTSDVNVIIHKRSTLKETYGLIISDLTSSIGLLPETQPYFQRPSLLAAKALLAKVYLAMGDYGNAGLYSNEVLKTKNQLLDFNNTSIIQYNSVNRFPASGVNNPEVLFYAETASYQSVRPSSISTGIVSAELYGLYSINDLRRSLFYNLRNNENRFVGTYAGISSNFSGIGINEVYLIRAECNARQGEKDKAMEDLNFLLKNRYKTGSFVQLTAVDAEDALKIVLIERRKELPFTGNLRWEDLRRLNQDPRFQKTLTRSVNGTEYTLLPNDKRYVYPIPDTEIQVSGIEQN